MIPTAGMGDKGGRHLAVPQIIQAFGVAAFLKPNGGNDLAPGSGGKAGRGGHPVGVPERHLWLEKAGGARGGSQRD